MADYQGGSQTSQATSPFRAADAPKILLVEDSPGEAELFRVALGFAWEARYSNSEVARPGIQVQCTAEDALESLRQTCDLNQRNVPDLVVLDLDLPLGTSLLFLRALRRDARFTKLPVIVMAWSDEPSIIGSLDELGIVGYTIKPMRFDDLVTIVGDFCSQIFPNVTRQELCAPDRRQDA